MKALRIPAGAPIAPFGDPVGEVPVLNTPLAAVQEAALEAAGCALVRAPPADEPYLIFSSRTWFTAAAIEVMIAAGPGRMKVDDAAWWAATGGLQELVAPGCYELGVVPAGEAPDLAALAPVRVDLNLTDHEAPDLHPAMRHALRPLRLGAAMVHQLDHWTHILRVNQLAIAARAEGARLRWEGMGWLGRLWVIAKVLLASRSVRKDRILAALSETGKGAQIHPTAVVEMCLIGEGVTIGPHAVVRAAVIGDGARIDEHATVNLSVVGQGASVGRYAMLNLSTLYPGAMVSHCGGVQVSVVGREAFIAWGATLLDLSFGKPVKVQHRGERVDSEQHFLGAAIGHRAKIGNAVRLNYGVSVPNDALLVAPASALIRDASAAPADVPVRAKDGGVEPLR